MVTAEGGGRWKDSSSDDGSDRGPARFPARRAGTPRSSGTSRTLEDDPDAARTRRRRACSTCSSRDAVRRLVLDTKPEHDRPQSDPSLAGDVDSGNASQIVRADEPLGDPTGLLLPTQKEAGVEAVVAQSSSSWRSARVGSQVKTKEQPNRRQPRREVVRDHARGDRVPREDHARAPAASALRYGFVLRRAHDALGTRCAERKVPIVGDGGGVLVAGPRRRDAAATVLALERGQDGRLQRRGRRPAPVREVSHRARREALDAPPPRKVPAPPLARELSAARSSTS